VKGDGDQKTRNGAAPLTPRAKDLRWGAPDEGVRGYTS
jgi:hypothetical protein